MRDSEKLEKYAAGCYPIVLLFRVELLFFYPY